MEAQNEQQRSIFERPSLELIESQDKSIFEVFLQVWLHLQKQNLIVYLITILETIISSMEKGKTGDFKLTQTFGDKSSSDKVAEEDVISAVEFDQSGKYLSLGDNAGRLIIFNMQQSKNKKSQEYTYYTELQSHVRQFDPLKSVDIEEKITAINWLKNQGKNMYVLTTNSKSIKLWKLSQKTIKKVVRSAGKDLAMPKLQVVEDGMVPSIIKTFPSLHSFNINAISSSNNQQYVLSSDDLKVYLWSLQDPSKAFVSVELKPENLQEVQETITTSTYHTSSDSLFAYGTSRGVLKMGDMRVSAICDNTAINFKYDPSGPKNFFTELISSYSSVKFTKNQKYLVARDFLTVKVWDLAMANKPVVTVPIHESMKSKLCEMYQNQSILQKFSLSVSSDSRTMATGNFNSQFHVVDIEGGNHQYQLNYNKKTICKAMSTRIQTLTSMDYARKTLRTTFHPTNNTIAVSCLNCFFIYNI